MTSSKSVNDRQRSATIVQEAARTHGPLVGGKLNTLFGPLQTDDNLAVDWVKVILLKP